MTRENTLRRRILANRRPYHAAVLVLLILLVACDFDPDDIPNGVTGTVTDAVTKAPISGATVAVSSQQTVTGPDGGLITTGIPEGRMRVRVTHPAYVDADREIVLSREARNWPVVDFSLTLKQ